MNKLSIPFILSLFFYISPINAKVPKVVSKSAKALAKVVTYNKAGDLIGNSVTFFAGQSNEAYSEYEIFKNATRAEVIDASGKKIEVKRICGADEIYDVIKFTTESAPKQSLEIAEKAEVQGSKVYIISSATTKKAVTVEAEISDRVCVMYGGKIAELASNEDIYTNAKHPYTRRLLAATPRLNKAVSKLEFIEGTPPDLLNPPKGCMFYDRCKERIDRCKDEEPILKDTGNGHLCACHLIN